MLAKLAYKYFFQTLCDYDNHLIFMYFRFP